MWLVGVCCSSCVAFLAILIGCLLSVLVDRGVLTPGLPVPEFGILTQEPSHSISPGVAEVIASLDTPSGNLAVSSAGRVIFNFHPEHQEPSGAKFAEVVAGSWAPRSDLDAHINTVLSLRISASDRLYLLDFAQHGFQGTPKMVVFQLGASSADDRFLYQYEFPKAVAGMGSMLNDFNLSPDEGSIFIADTGMVSGTPALLACQVFAMEMGLEDACQRRLQGHRSVIPEAVDINVNGDSPLVIARSVHIRIGVDSIALDRQGEWLYYAPVSSSTLWRVPARKLLLQATEADAQASVEAFSSKPITDGISVDNEGNVLLTAFEHSAVAKVDATSRNISVVLRDRHHLQWPDGLSFGPDNWLYVTSSALHHSFSGRRVADFAPFYIVRMKMDVGAAAGQ